MAYIHLYKGAVTAGGTDGNQVSEGDNSNPLEVGTLNITVGEESEPIKLALRCEDGYETRNEVTLTPTGDTANKWNLALDNNGVPGDWNGYGSTLIISETIGATNYIIWVKAKAEVNESLADDQSVKLHLSAPITSVDYAQQE